MAGGVRKLHFSSRSIYFYSKIFKHFLVILLYSCLRLSAPTVIRCDLGDILFFLFSVGIIRLLGKKF